VRVGSLIGSVITATSGFQGIMGTAAAMALMLPGKAVSTAEAITAAVRRELRWAQPNTIRIRYRVL